MIRVFCTVKTEGKTGVEMEALTGVQVTLLTIYDMCKAIDKHMVMSDIHLEEKTGGKAEISVLRKIMIDRCGRNIDYLRISVTDRCNLRCIYCMPEEGVQHVERSLILQEEEILRICRVMAELGIRKIKLTGGEPLVRPRMPQLVEKLKNMPGIEKVTLTTNGVLLKDQMSDFARAGLDGLNISLDTLDEVCSRRITRRDELDRTLEGISEVLKYPEISLKINCVPLGIPEQDLCRVAFLARDYKVHVRFIEMMPIGMGKEFHGVSEEELLGILREKCFRGFRRMLGSPLGMDRVIIMMWMGFPERSGLSAR